jgi:hypothetical protein
LSRCCSVPETLCANPAPIELPSISLRTLRLPEAGGNWVRQVHGPLPAGGLSTTQVELWTPAFTLTFFICNMNRIVLCNYMCTIDPLFTWLWSWQHCCFVFCWSSDQISAPCSFLTWAIDENESSVSLLVAIFTEKEHPVDTYWLGSWMSSRYDLDILGRKIICYTCRK